MKKIKVVLVTTLTLIFPIVLLAGNYSYKTKKSMDIVHTAISSKSFHTLVAALKAADLVDTLMGEGPFTVFAPTDEASAKLPEGTLEDLLKPENKTKLQSILTYHVVPGKYTADEVVKMNSAKTVNGKSFSIGNNNGSAVGEAI
jgi:uncharacterized surface protein with fasciclin (FAS1) repeats